MSYKDAWSHGAHESTEYSQTVRVCVASYRNYHHIFLRWKYCDKMSVASVYAGMCSQYPQKSILIMPPQSYISDLIFFANAHILMKNSLCARGTVVTSHHSAKLGSGHVLTRMKKSKIEFNVCAFIGSISIANYAQNMIHADIFIYTFFFNILINWWECVCVCSQQIQPLALSQENQQPHVSLYFCLFLSFPLFCRSFRQVIPFSSEIWSHHHLCKRRQCNEDIQLQKVKRCWKS